jgi:hypothetical protein
MASYLVGIQYAKENLERKNCVFKLYSNVRSNTTSLSTYLPVQM